MQEELEYWAEIVYPNSKKTKVFHQVLSLGIKNLSPQSFPQSDSVTMTVIEPLTLSQTETLAGALSFHEDISVIIKPRL